MIKKDFLQVYDLELTVSSPVHIGNGTTILKNSFLFDPVAKTVTIFNEEKLFTLIIQAGQVDSYEQFMLGSVKNLDYFLRNVCKFTPKDWKSAIRYTLDARHAFDRNHSLKDIHTFVRDPYGRVYVPGSSVKGALRTVLLQKYILADTGKRAPYDPKRFDSILSEQYLHTLRLRKNRPGDAVNSLMRGIQISDSLPVSDDAMILTIKRDAHVDGSFGAGRGVVCRESIRPGTKIHMKLTLDQSILKESITKESIMEAIDRYNDYYWDTYVCSFDKVEREAEVSYADSLILGGGSGFFAKTLVYPYLGKEKAVDVTAQAMQRSFRKHKHEKDPELGISPHTMEYTNYGGENYPMGLCEVSIR